MQEKSGAATYVADILSRYGITYNESIAYKQRRWNKDGDEKH